MFIIVQLVKTLSPLLVSGNSQGFHKLPSGTHLMPVHYRSVIIYRRLGTVSVFVVKGKVIPLEALRVPGVRGTQISRQSIHEGGKVVSPTHRPSLPPGSVPDTHFCQRLSQPQGHVVAGRIMSVTQSGIESATFRLVPQYLNQLRHRVPSLCLQ